MKRLGLAFLVLFWVAGSLGGYAYILRYSARPALLDEPAAQWPQNSEQARDPQAYTLVMAVHPQCPCTRASVAELNKLLQRWQGKVQAQALIYKPFEFKDLWAESDITQRLRALPYTELHRDLDGSQAARFGLSASGQVLLYGRDGKLLFNGGLTAFRGHEGRSVGQAQLLALVDGKRAPKGGSVKAFGCSLKEKVCTHPVNKDVTAGGDHG